MDIRSGTAAVASEKARIFALADVIQPLSSVIAPLHWEPRGSLCCAAWASGWKAGRRSTFRGDDPGPPGFGPQL